MSSPAPLRTRPSESAPPVVGELNGAADEATEQNEESVPQHSTDADEPDTVINPLRAVAIGMACLFGALALLLAFG